jgi:hypothetical protein
VLQKPFVLPHINKPARSLALLVTLSFSLMPNIASAATWTPITKPDTAPSSLGTMILLTDGSVMILDGTDNQHWLKLTPDNKGDYSQGNFGHVAPMSIGRLYFASEVMQNGNVWVLGGEYTGPYSSRTDTNSGEIYDSVSNSWSPITPYPNQSGCGPATILSDVKLTAGAKGANGIFSTFGMQVGWTVSGSGIPSGATIAKIDSDKKVTLSVAATTTGPSTKVQFAGPRVGCYGAVPSMLLPGKKILAGDLVSGSTYVYDPATDTWSQAGSKAYTDPSDEESWGKLADGKILTYDLAKSVDLGGSYAELYDPKTDMWTSISPSDTTAGGTLPSLSSAALGYELGDELLLQDNKMFLIGGNQHTALYTPSTNTWAAGPDILSDLIGPGGTIASALFGSDDAPAAELPNGHVIFAADAGPNLISITGTITSGSAVVTISSTAGTAGLQVGWTVVQSDGNSDVIPKTSIVSVDSHTQVTLADPAVSDSSAVGLNFGGTFSAPTKLFDFDPKAGTISAVSPPINDPTLSTTAAFTTRMLMLPTGQLLYNDSTNLFVYTPDGTTKAALLPTVDSVVYQGAGVFKLTGSKLNGQSAGAGFGDDAPVDENYPIVRLINAKGRVFYCRTTDWNSTGVGDGKDVKFTLDSKVTAGDYSLIESGAGISSLPFPITITQAQVNGQ